MNLLRTGLLTALAVGALVSLEDTISIERARIDVRQEKSALSVVAFTAKKGDKLTVLEKGTDGWMKVSRAEGGEGYLRAAMLTDTPLKFKPDGNPLSELAGSKDADASAAAKGVNEDVLKYAGGKGYDARPLTQMIDTRNSITDADLAKFKSEGGLK